MVSDIEHGCCIMACMNCASHATDHVHKLYSVPKTNRSEQYTTFAYRIFSEFVNNDLRPCLLLLIRAMSAEHIDAIKKYPENHFLFMRPDFESILASPFVDVQKEIKNVP